MTEYGSGRLVPQGTGRALAVSNIAVGLATIARAGDLADSGWLGLSPVAFRRVIRVLGARQAAQGFVTALRTDAEVLVVGAAVDVLHALSMVPFAMIAGPYRRQAAVSAALASASAMIGIAASEQ